MSEYQTDNPALKAIFTRRSIRKYTGELVPKALLDQVLTAGFCAPSAHNFRPWDFVLVKDKNLLETIADNGKYMKMVRHCDTAVIVCGDTARQTNHDLLVNDCSAAVENMLLAAHALGLGAVWCGVVHPEQIRFFQDRLKMPGHIVPAALIAIGYPDEERAAPDRFDPAHVHEECFSENK